MNCLEFEIALDELIDGAPASEALRAHRAACAACRALEDAARALRAETAALPREMTPPRGLWPGIEAAIGAHAPARNRRPAWRTAAMAAAACAALFAGWAALQRSAQPGTAPSAPAEALAMEQAYETSRGALVAAIEARRQHLPAETLDAVEHSLGVIDGAVAEIRTALEASPDDARLLHHLARTQTQALDMLAAVARTQTN